MMIENKFLNNKSTILLIILASTIFAQIPDKPNIVLLFLDDAGYADFGFNGNQDFLTPRMDEIASKGVKFTRGYVSASVCHPSRAGLITGRKQERFGHQYNGSHDLPAEQITIAEQLKPAGYKSMLVGKWHMGGGEGHPIDQGFDEFIGIIGGSSSYWDVELQKNKESQKVSLNGRYVTDVYGDEAVAFIERNVNNPFFLFLSLTAVHSPNHFKDEHKALFANTTLSGGRQSVAAMTYGADSIFGMVVDKLEELNLTAKTLVILTNDNGGGFGRVNLPFSAMKGNMLEGGIRVPYLMYWPGVFTGGTTYDFPVSTLDIFATSSALANVPMPSDREMDGINLMPFVLGQRKDRPHKYLYFDRHFSGMIYMDYKVVLLEDTLGNKRQPVLYDLSGDITEVNNLAFEKPGLTTAMINEIERWIKEETATPLRVEGNNWKNSSLGRYGDRGLTGNFVPVDSGIILEPETTDKVSANKKPIKLGEDVFVSKDGDKIQINLQFKSIKDLMVSVHLIDGKIIRNLKLASKTINWNGRDSEGNFLNSGLYVLKVSRNNLPLKSKLFYL